jgi:outer membrane protein assembly factor BamB
MVVRNKPGLLAYLICAACASVAPAAAPPRSETARSSPRGRGVDWPRFLGPTADGKSPETGINTNWSAGGLPVVWQRKLGESYGIGTVSQGKFFQFDRYGEKVRLTCLDARTGKDLWKSEYPTDYEDLFGYNGGPRCSPVIDGDRVYLFGVEGRLQCVSAADGKPIWGVDTAQRFGVVQNFFGVASLPVVEGQLLLVMVGGSPPESQQVPRGQLDQVVGQASGIVAFDKLTGEVVYHITDELASYATLKLATIQGRRWCFAFARGGLVGFEPSTGKVDFHYPWRAKLLESVNASTPVVVNDQVLISETYGPGSSLLRVRPGGYEVIWRDDPRRREKALQAHWNTPIHHDGYLYGCSGRHTANAELRCLDWKTGTVQWSVPGLTRSSLLYVDGHFICLGEDGVLRLFKANPKKFEPVSEARLRDERGEPLLQYPCWAAPILSHGLLYVRGRDRLVCLRLSLVNRLVGEQVP